jgi:hypothetical protein
MDLIVVGDPHAKPGVSNRRFTWLGKVICDLKPDAVVLMGDHADMESLSSYDGSALTGSTRPKKSFEGRRYNLDVEAAVEALDRVHVELQKAGRKRPRRIALGGNHDEERISRAVQNVPELEGVLSLKDFQFDKYGYEYVPFKDVFELGGFGFSHFMSSGVMGKPVGGEHPAANLLKTQYTSCVVGHSHVFNEAHRTSAKGKRIQAFVSGCFLDPTQTEHYAGPANAMWSKGLLYMRDVDNGLCRGGYDWITMTRIMKAYSQ